MKNLEDEQYLDEGERHFVEAVVAGLRAGLQDVVDAGITPQLEQAERRTITEVRDVAGKMDNLSLHFESLAKSLPDALRKSAMPALQTFEEHLLGELRGVRAEFEKLQSEAKAQKSMGVLIAVLTLGTFLMGLVTIFFGVLRR